MKQTGDELEEIFIGDQTEYVVAVDLSENTAVPEINGEPTEISDKPEASREEPVEEAQTEAEEVENYAAPSILDPNLNGAFADAIPLNHLFARPSHIFTLAPNVATLDQDYRLSYMTPSNLSSLLYNRGIWFQQVLIGLILRTCLRISDLQVISILMKIQRESRSFFMMGILLICFSADGVSTICMILQQGIHLSH